MYLFRVLGTMNNSYRYIEAVRYRSNRNNNLHRPTFAQRRVNQTDKGIKDGR